MSGIFQLCLLLACVCLSSPCNPIAIPAMAPAAAQLGAGLLALGSTIQLGNNLGHLGGRGLNPFNPGVEDIPPLRRPYPIPIPPRKPVDKPVNKPKINDPEKGKEEKIDPEVEKKTEPETKPFPHVLPIPGIQPHEEEEERTEKPGCMLKINTDFGNKSPLILKPTGTLDEYRFFLPEEDTDNLLFQSKDKVLLACPGKGNSFQISGKQTLNTEITVSCESGKKFLVDGISTIFSDILCRDVPDSEFQLVGKCYKNLDKYELGFKLKMGLISLIEVCYDPDLHTTMYTKHKILKSVENKQKNVARSSYFSKDVFGTGLSVQPDKFYNCKEGQFQTFEEILGSKNAASNYVDCNFSNNKYLAKGHLSAYADFTYYAQQKATMQYLLTVPQWQGFNVGNWKTLEDRLRIYAYSNKKDLIIYSGSLGVLRINDTNNNGQDIYLSKDLNNNKVVPIPAILYKIIYDQGMTSGTVVIGLNNINATVAMSRYSLCTNVCHKTLTFSTAWNMLDVNKGYMYCCSIKDFLIATGLTSIFPGINLPLFG